MKYVWFVSDCIVSPLGRSTEENFRSIISGNTGIKRTHQPDGFYASLMSDVTQLPEFTRFESLAIMAARGALGNFSPDPATTMMILSTTKGNISLLGTDHPRIQLHASADYIARAVGINRFLVLSNACISGTLALTVACRFLNTDNLDHVLVVGADEISSFITSGFMSLQALSSGPCRPFDSTRDGLSLGEGAGAVLLSTAPGKHERTPVVRIAGGGASNDANHISGPSRTGKELALAINQALRSAGLEASSIDAICAHGTGTRYNDEMEASAFAHAGLSKIPVFGLKGYFGHTLGAAGVIETIISKHAMVHDSLPATAGYHSSGVSNYINVSSENESVPMQHILKTASGFGGCNAALILEKST